jgi:hypothetical protein
MWVIGTNKEGGGFGVYKWLGKRYQKVNGSALQISVDAAGNPWLVNNAKAIYKHDGKRWLRRPGAAYDIGVGSEGTVWVIGTNREGGGFGIYRSSEGANQTLWASQTQGAMNWRKGVRWVVRQQAKGFVIKKQGGQTIYEGATRKGCADRLRLENNGTLRVVCARNNRTQWAMTHGNQKKY